MAEEKVKNDSALEEWFRQHPNAETTVMICEKCGLHYKPILGHKCKKGGVDDVVSEKRGH